MNFIDLLSKCDEVPSTATRTGIFFKLNGAIILEYMKSSRNVWIDDDIAGSILPEHKKEYEAQIREFFHGRVKNVYFGFPLNEGEKKLKDRIYNILDKFEL